MDDTRVRGAARSELAMWALNDHRLGLILWLALWLAVLVVLVAVAACVIGKLRGKVREERASALDLLSKFRDVHSQGGLSDAEFRTIKTRLAEQTMKELKDKDEKG
jgi:hypothetical protein